LQTPGFIVKSGEQLTTKRNIKSQKKNLGNLPPPTGKTGGGKTRINPWIMEINPAAFPCPPASKISADRQANPHKPLRLNI